MHLDEDIVEHVVTSDRNSAAFAIQLDESTDVASLSQIDRFCSIYSRHSIIGALPF